MTRDEIINSGLLDQYVLGLTDPEQNELIERLMAEDPRLAQEVEQRHASLGAYADAHRISPPAGNRPTRTAEDFYSLDHEMILEMTERNHALNIWRYALLSVCLALVALSGYLFRLKEDYRGQLVTESALHAQDERTHQHEVDQLRTELDGRTEFTALRAPSQYGDVRAFVNRPAKALLVDLRALLPPAPEHHYTLTVHHENGDRTLPVDRPPHDQLYSLDLHPGDRELRLSYGSATGPGAGPPPQPFVVLPLPAGDATARTK